MSEVDLSIVIPSWNTRELTRECLTSLHECTGALRREIIVVDNASEDGSADMVERAFPDAVLIRNPENRLYAAANNQGARRAAGRYLCLLNSDTRVRSGALERLVTFLDEHPEYGAASPKLLDPDGTVQRACCRFPPLALPLVESTSLRHLRFGRGVFDDYRMRDFDHLESRDVDQPPAACMVVRRREYLAMGGLDPTLSLYFNDVDLCRRLWRAGRRVRYVADAEVYHHRGGSTRELELSWRTVLYFQNREAYFRKHYGWPGKLWLEAVLLAHAGEQAARITLGPQPLARSRASLRQLGQLVARCLRPAGMMGAAPS